VHQAGTLERSLSKQQVSMYHNRVGNPLSVARRVRKTVLTRTIVKVDQANS